MGLERHGRVWRVGFGPTPFGNHMRILEECSPPSTSTATNQKFKEMMTQIASLEEKCHGFESLEAEMFDEEIVFSNESTTYFY